jgi:histidinol-phosphate aminotransferase
VSRVMLRAEEGYELRPELAPPEADLVVLGNPTNPTSVLHPANPVRKLAAPGRVIVVDEAFADAVPGEPQSLSSDRATPGLLVLRSLTKTWALASRRAGYALGSADLLTRLSTGRPHWPVGTLNLEAVPACCEPPAVAEAEASAEFIAYHRRWLAGELAAIPGMRGCQPAHAPFLLVQVPDGPRVLTRLRAAGIAVRRCDIFPGLTPDHLRIAVRPPGQATVLLETLLVAVSGDAIV